jgi:hypothetical protein
MQVGGGWGKLLEDKPPNAVLLEAQKYVRDRLEKKWLPLFLATETFAERQRPKTAMDDVVDDVLVQKRRRSQAVWKVCYEIPVLEGGKGVAECHSSSLYSLPFIVSCHFPLRFIYLLN